MNERTKELALQSGIIRILDQHASEFGNGVFENTSYSELAKFAQLIVQDCKNLIFENTSCIEMKCLNAIDVHFGVKE